MKIESIAKQLSEIDDILLWSSQTTNLDKITRKEVFEIAEPMWIKRMVNNGKLLLNPNVITNLRNNSWRANSLHRKMFWASILASLVGNDSKERFKIIKQKLIKKHGNNWWFDVYKRHKVVYAIRQSIINQLPNAGSATSIFMENTHIGRMNLHLIKQKALKQLPEN